MVIKLIRTFILLFAGLAIVMHMIIPHDHHLTVPVNGLKESCAMSHEKTGHRPFFPEHCHAFNDMAADRLAPVIVRLETQTSYASVIWKPDSSLPGLNVSFTIIENTGKPFPDIYIPDFSPFRAPPFMS
jgi:hypothetical protein